MRRAGLVVVAIALCMTVPSASALPAGCAGANFDDFPGQTSVWYDLSSCVPLVSDDIREGDETFEPIGEAFVLIVGSRILGEWGVCLVAEPDTQGSVYVDLENDCDQDPCERLAQLFQRMGVLDDPCDALDPCAAVDDAECDLRVLTASTGSTRAIGSAPGQGASL